MATFRPARAFCLWHVGGLSLLAAWSLGVSVQLTVPPASTNAAQLSGTLSLSDVGGSLAGATFNGITNFDYSGRSVFSAGNVNGDGWNDLLIGAYQAEAGGSDRGESYLVYGPVASVGWTVSTDGLLQLVLRPGSRLSALEEASRRSKTCALLLFSNKNRLPRNPTWGMEISAIAFHLS